MPPLSRRQHQHQQSTTTRSISSRLDMSSSSTTDSIITNNPVLALYDKFQDSLPNGQVIQVCDGQRNVVASDVAAKAGIPLRQAERELQLLASLSQASIAVSNDGDLMYSFDTNLESVLAQQSSQYKLQQSFQKIWPTLFWGLRVSFGLALVASLVAIYSTIFFINSSSSSSDDDRRGDRRGGGGGMMGGMGGGWFWGPSPFDFFFYRPYGYYGYYGYGAERSRRDPEELGFFESVYSYVFGDGNPNLRLEERRLQLAAQMIRSNDGAVTAEQLAPYCDPTITPQQAAESNYVDESFVLPIVTQLNGEPTVTDEGDIVYVFPELQTTSGTTATTSPSTAVTAAAAAAKSAAILKRAGLSPNANAREIQLLLSYNGISTRGAYEKSDLIRLLERALPPLTAQERAKLERETDVEDPTILAEREIPFSVATDLNRVLAGGLGVVNLAGSLYLGSQLGQLAAAGVTLPGFYGTIAGLYPLLLGYAVLFNAIPVVRNLWIQNQNDSIRKRNALRKEWRQALMNRAGTNLQQKLQAAKAFAMKQRRLGTGKKDILYDTASTTMEDLSKQKEQMEMSAFDKLLQQEDDNKKGGGSGGGGGAFE